MTKNYYPIALDVAEKRCLVVGGGVIATDKVEGLFTAGADVSVVSPEVTARLSEWARARRIRLYQRRYRKADLQGVYLAYGATDDRDVNAQVSSDARAAGILVNAVDDTPNCDFIAMAIVRRGDLGIAISTNGRSPAFARWMRESLDAWLPAEYAGLLDALAEARIAVRAAGEVPPYERWRDAITADVLSDVREGRQDAVRSRLIDTLLAPA